MEMNSPREGERARITSLSVRKFLFENGNGGSTGERAVRRMTRRHLLQLLGLAPAAQFPFLVSLRQAGPPSRGGTEKPAKPLFEAVPASVSGITWKHVNGRSTGYYLPETTGAGCAFLDYDNDGWMEL